jgi:tripartite-type tricarboxylate transporter receptor subunit TctC
VDLAWHGPAFSSKRAAIRLGVEPSGVSGDQFNEIVRRDYARWGEIIRRNNLRAD